VTLPRFDYGRNSQHVNLGYDNKNGIYAKNQYSAFPPCMKQCVAELNDSANLNQSYVTLDDYQKMVSQFTNMILKLNYKFNQVLDNSISREELNQITRKFELQVENLTQRVNELSLKLEKTNSELASRLVTEYKCQRSSDPIVRCVNDHKCCQAPKNNFEAELNDSHQISGQSPKQLCVLSNGQQQRQPDFECKNHQRVETEDFRTDRISQDRTKYEQI
jgi:arsenate reductase-like glutaredoxin family protein